MNSNSSQDDKALFIRIANGDGESFTVLFKRYFDRLKWNAVKMLKSEFWAEEIIQDVFMQLWTNRERLIDIESPSAYLFHITANRCLDRIRHQNREVKAQYLLNQAHFDQPGSLQQNSYDIRLIETMINEAVRLLPEKGRQVFKLQRTGNFSYQEIADQLGISKNTVRNHMVKSLHFIRVYLAEKGEFFLLIFSCWYFF
jgi:RNA polymerase sigma-70 factor (ECF subfamily)